MTDGRHIPFERHHSLDSEDRQREQPAGPLVELLVASGARVVADIGAGTGYFALPLAERLPGGRVLCLDIEPRMLDVVRLRAEERGLGERVELVHMTDAHILPLADASVDAAFMVSLYHELDGRPRFLAELQRSLRPGGLVAVVDWRPDGTADHGPRPHHRIAATVALAEIAAAGFADPREHRLYANHWVVTAAKPA
jgi:ubiquinone/menaquinone biosynthesis C-methylase UbiE